MERPAAALPAAAPRSDKRRALGACRLISLCVWGEAPGETPGSAGGFDSYIDVHEDQTLYQSFRYRSEDAASGVSPSRLPPGFCPACAGAAGSRHPEQRDRRYENAPNRLTSGSRAGAASRVKSISRFGAKLEALRLVQPKQ